MQVDKLVRDHVPDELRRLGRTIGIRTAIGDEYVRRLKEKLIEEASEVARAHDDAVIDELADVLEVLIALMAARGESLDLLLAAATAKRQRLGGFSDGMILLDNGLPDAL